MNNPSHSAELSRESRTVSGKIDASAPRGTLRVTQTKIPPSVLTSFFFLGLFFLNRATNFAEKKEVLEV